MEQILGAFGGNFVEWKGFEFCACFLFDVDNGQLMDFMNELYGPSMSQFVS